MPPSVECRRNAGVGPPHQRQAFLHRPETHRPETLAGARGISPPRGLRDLGPPTGAVRIVADMVRAPRPAAAHRAARPPALAAASRVSAKYRWKIETISPRSRFGPWATLPGISSTVRSGTGGIG